MSRPPIPTRGLSFCHLMDPTDTLKTEYFHRVVDCQWACPAHTDVPEYIRLVAQGRFGDAYLLNRESNVFPAILGRVCDRPCEPACRRGRVEEKPVAICRLKRVAADYRGDIESRLPVPAQRKNGRRIALVGAGSASLTVANDLAPLGYECVIFEALARPGGLMRTNIPAFRLPAEVLDEEIGYVTRLGVEIKLESPVASLRALLAEGYDAVFIGSGAPKGKNLRLPGREASDRIHIGIDWLGSIAFGHVDSIGERVLIIGVGNTAMDCCRSSLRLGAKDVKVIARKPRQFFKASDWELEDAEEERVEIVVNHSPKEFVVEDGKLIGMRFDELEHDLDSSGEIVASRVLREVFLPCDDVVLAIGQENAFPWIERDLGVTFDRHDVPVVDVTTFQSTRPGVFFGGDAAFGPKNIIWAVEHGHQAAISIHKHCEGTSLTERLPRGVTLTSAKMGIHEWSYSNAYEPAVRRIMPHVDLRQRFKKLDIEVELGFTAEQFATEVERCLNCDLQTVFTADLCIECDACIDICPVDCLAITPNGTEQELSARLKAARLDVEQQLFVSAPLKHTARVMLKDENICVHCGLCAERCPTGAWDMQKSTVKIPYAQDEARLEESEWQSSRKAG
jgi:NADPH-dependent glutamate synthase beta subunit-like oxidoreductase/ferredoxin